MVLLLFMAAIWLLTFITTSSLRRDLEDVLAAQQFSAASYVADEIEQSVRLRLNALAIIGSEIDPPLLGDPAKMQDHLRHRPLLRSLFGIGVWVITANGSPVTAYPLETFDPALRFNDVEYFRDVMATGKPTVGKPRLGRVSGRPSIGFAAPILANNGAIIGVLTGYSLLSDPTLFGSLERANVGKTGWIAVSAPAHQLIVSSSDPKRILDRTALPGANKVFDKFVAGFAGSGVTINSKGVETLTSAKQIPAAGWLAQVVLPTDEAFAPIHNLTIQIYSIAAGLSLLVAFLTWRVIRRLLQPLAATNRQIEDMAFRDGPLTTLDVTRNDEVGALQLAFNRLAVARNEAHARINAQRQEIASLSQHLQSVREDERTYVARELHDELGQLLTALKMDISLLHGVSTGEDSLKIMDSMTSLTDEAMSTIYRMASRLRPVMLDDLGLNSAIEWLVEDFRKRYTEISWTLVHDIGSRKIDADAATCVYRVIQECLTNAVRHAQASEIHIVVSLRNPWLLAISVQDNGRGFNEQNRKEGGFGLLGMRERVTALSGSLVVESIPNEGVSVDVTIPLSENANRSTAQ